MNTSKFFLLPRGRFRSSLHLETADCVAFPDIYHVIAENCRTVERSVTGCPIHLTGRELSRRKPQLVPSGSRFDCQYIASGEDKGRLSEQHV